MTDEPVAHHKDIWAWVAIRFLLAWFLLWAFFDKLLGLGYATQPGHAWINGVSPTTGYLKFGSGGLFSGLFQGLANNAVVDVLFMAALLLIGGALLLGIGRKITTVAGVLFFALLWLSNFPPVNNPIIDEHVIYMAALLGIYWSKAGYVYGLGKRWSETKLVKRLRFLE